MLTSTLKLIASENKISMFFVDYVLVSRLLPALIDIFGAYFSEDTNKKVIREIYQL